MNQMCLRLFGREGERHHGRVLHDFLLDLARECGAGGVTVLRASAGYGRHGLHEDHFFELGGELPVVVETVLEDAQARQLLARCSEEGLRLFYTLSPVETGMTGVSS